VILKTLIQGLIHYFKIKSYHKLVFSAHFGITKALAKLDKMKKLLTNNGYKKIQINL